MLCSATRGKHARQKKKQKNAIQQTKKNRVKYIKKLMYTPAVRSNILSKLFFASCVRYPDPAYNGLCVLIEGIGRRLPLQLQCSYQGQQGDVNQSVRGNYRIRFLRGQNLTAVEGNASVYQVNPNYIYITPSPPPPLTPLVQTHSTTSLKTPPSPHRLYDLQDTLDKQMHFLPQLSDFVPHNGFYCFRAQAD